MSFDPKKNLPKPATRFALPTAHGSADAYDQAGHGFQFVRVAGGWRYQTHAEMSPYVERYLLDGQRARMSGAALETLAIVAYKQPISRAQIASIRGVDPDGVLRTSFAQSMPSAE